VKDSISPLRSQQSGP